MNSLPRMINGGDFSDETIYSTFNYLYVLGGLYPSCIQPTNQGICFAQIADYTGLEYILISIPNKNNNQPRYEIKLSYTGDTKAENVVFKTGDATVTLPSIEKNQYTIIGSSYSSNDTQIQVAVTWSKGDQGFKQTVLFDV